MNSVDDLLELVLGAILLELGLAVVDQAPVGHVKRTQFLVKNLVLGRALVQDHGRNDAFSAGEKPRPEGVGPVREDRVVTLGHDGQVHADVVAVVKLTAP